MGKNIELHVAAYGGACRVRVDGEDLRGARSFTIRSSFDEVTTVEIESYYRLDESEPQVIRGLLITEDDPNYAVIRKYLEAPSILHEVVPEGCKRVPEARHG